MTPQVRDRRCRGDFEQPFPGSGGACFDVFFSMILADLLSKPFSLAMAPGFFRIYSHVGIMAALHEAKLLNVHAVSGSSAGAMGAGFLATGLTPPEMIKEILKIERVDMWDSKFGFRAGLLKGELLQEIFERSIPIQELEKCVIPCGVAAYDIIGMQTSIITKGSVATAMRASACFPLLFAPVYYEGRPHIDGGVFDRNGFMALPSIPAESKLIVNIVFDRTDVSSHYEQLPQRFKDDGAQLLTIVVNNLLFCGPQNMNFTGPASYLRSRDVMKAALDSCHLSYFAPGHYICVLDASEKGARKASKSKRVYDTEEISSKMPKRRRMKV